jgi:hypothetical protein
MKYQLLRFKENAQGCPGVFLLDNEWIISTLEPDAKDLERYQIPVGMYYCYKVKSPKFGETFEIRVEGHTLIRFHWGNTEQDTTACILTGFTKRLNWIGESQIAHEYFMKRLEGINDFMLEVLQWERKERRRTSLY